MKKFLKGMVMCSVSLALCYIMVNCDKNGIPVNYPTDGDASTVANQICQNMGQAGCLEAKDPGCAGAVDKIINSNQVNIDTKCLLDASTPSAFRACGQTCQTQ